MAGFFSLGSSSTGSGLARINNNQNQNQNQQDGNLNLNQNLNHQINGTTTDINPESWFLYRNHDQDNTNISSFRGFELWHPTHHEQNHHHRQDLFSSPGAGLAVGSTRISIDGSDGPRSGGGGISCQDCGNQAKKDCTYIRCRTCCKNRGFPCQTHVRSTWVPAAKRRERQLQLQQQDQQQPRPPPPPSSSLTHPKRQRDNNNNNNNPTGHDATSSQHHHHHHLALHSTTTHIASAALELGHNFPARVNSAAVFNMVRLSSVEEMDDQIAYQTAVNIGGHVFKGILYDHGSESQYMSCESSSGTTGALNLISPNNNNNTITAAGADAATSVTVASPTTMFLDPSIYPAAAAQPYNSFMSGTQFFPHTRH